MTKQATPHARLIMVSTLRCRLKRSASRASPAMLLILMRASIRPRDEHHGAILPVTPQRSYRSASTGVSDAARHAGINADAIAITPSAENAHAVVAPRTGNPANISGIGNEFT